MVPYQNSLYIPSNPTLILLHGGPGVGKTTTAEYLAEHTRRPLLSTTSAAIIKHEREAETTFKQILHQATRWKAILLLENVELIFSEERGDRHGSSAILILKALETHHGLVFLTTDRIGLLVSSLISRINIPLELFPLPHEAKMMILRNLVEDHTLVLDREEGEELLQLARDHWKEMDDDQLNGSDIQNAFRNASRMTMTAMEKAETQRPNSLWWEYLKDSLQLQIERQECLQDIKGQPEEDVALMSRWRRPFKFQRSQLHARQVPGQPYLGNPGHRLSPDSLAHAPSLEATQEDIDT
jgi:SpoVK/Ycf46/Vps4 family AAA+-type ATPase